MLSKSEIKYLRSLKLKKFRQKYSQFIVEGEKSITELFTSDYLVDKVVGLPVSRPSFVPHEIEYLSISSKDLEQISSHKNPQGLIALVSILIPLKEEINGLEIALDDIQDPGNLGTIIRIADWYGIKKITCSLSSVDLYNPKTLAASMGSFCRVNVFYADLNQYIKDYPHPTWACTMEGESVYKLGNQTAGLIVIGNEGQGIKEEILKLCSAQIAIPRKGKAESLNAAIATAIICDNLSK